MFALVCTDKTKTSGCAVDKKDYGGRMLMVENALYKDIMYYFTDTPITNAHLNRVKRSVLFTRRNGCREMVIFSMFKTYSSSK